MDNDYNKIIAERKQEIQNMKMVCTKESLINQAVQCQGSFQSSVLKALDIDIVLQDVPSEKRTINKISSSKLTKNIFDNRRSSANNVEFSGGVSRNKQQSESQNQDRDLHYSKSASNLQ